MHINLLGLIHIKIKMHLIDIYPWHFLFIQSCECSKIFHGVGGCVVLDKMPLPILYIIPIKYQAKQIEFILPFGIMICLLCFKTFSIQKNVISILKFLFIKFSPKQLPKDMKIIFCNCLKRLSQYIFWMFWWLYGYTLMMFSFSRMWKKWISCAIVFEKIREVGMYQKKIQKWISLM
jgi:hypothetical protein